jgi:hypothetical protein
VDPILRERIERLMWQLDTTESWLARHIRPPSTRPKVRALAASLADYIIRCRKRVKEGRFTDADVDRWSEKIKRAAYVLWEVRRDD